MPKEHSPAISAPMSRRASLGHLAGAAAVLATAGCGKSPPKEAAPDAPLKPTESPKPFHVRTAEERAAAVGDLTKLSPLERRAFSAGPPKAFRPMGEPRPGDWLSEQPEAGQTFDEWVASKPNLAKPPRTTIDLLPLGDWTADAPSHDVLKAFTGAFFGLKVRVRPTTPLDGLPFKRRKRGDSEQLLTTDVNDWMRTQLRPDTYCALAVTMTDLYPRPSWNFVFGQARLYQRVGVFSFIRHDPGFGGRKRTGDWKRQWLRRSLSTLAHETGHMFGVDHCVFYECLLSGSNSLQESDRRSLALCPVCLRKLRRGAGFDIETRYERLAAFYNTQGFEPEDRWVQRRLAWIRDA